MSAQTLTSTAIALLPVLLFLAALVHFDSYRLVSPRLVIGAMLCGGATLAASYYVNGIVVDRVPIHASAFTRYVAPLTEEVLKGLVIVVMIRVRRIGFLVDAAIIGFAVGTGFAVAENLYYLHELSDAGLGTWIVRGFGTAIMHGGASAIVAMVGLSLLERAEGSSVQAILPGLLVAVVIHSAFNYLSSLSPKLATLGIMVVLPPLLQVVFQRSEAAIGYWLGKGFDADTEMLELINSGRFSDSPTGRYLHTLTSRMHGAAVADVLCYLRLYTELALRAKGILLMRQYGFDVPVDDETRAKFAELRYLKRSIGRTELLAIQPMLHMGHQDLWQIYMLRR